MEIMNYDHPQWQDFIIELSHAVKNPDMSHKYTIEILEKFKNVDPEIDIDSSIEFMKSKHGYDDMEVLMNVCSIQAIASEYVDLDYNGRYATCCCPFHGEEVPSFIIDQGKQKFKCYGCGKSGDVNDFLNLIKNNNLKSIKK